MIDRWIAVRVIGCWSLACVSMLIAMTVAQHINKLPLIALSLRQDDTNNAVWYDPQTAVFAPDSSADEQTVRRFTVSYRITGGGNEDFNVIITENGQSELLHRVDPTVNRVYQYIHTADDRYWLHTSSLANLQESVFYEYDLATREQRQVLRYTTGSPRFSWPSPDTAWYAFTSADDDDEAQFTIMNLQTGAITARLPYAVSDVEWSPDSRWLAAVGTPRGDDKLDVYLHDLRGGRTIHKVIAARELGFYWFADPRYILIGARFESNMRVLQQQLYVLDAERESLTALAVPTARNFYPTSDVTVAADAPFALTLSGSAGAFDVQLIDVRAATMRPLFTVPVQGDLSLSDDGQYIASNRNRTVRLLNLAGDVLAERRAPNASIRLSGWQMTIPASVFDNRAP